MGGIEKGEYENMSFAITAVLRPCSVDFRVCSNNVLLPEPRKPESRVTGSCLICGP
jgi:hypothetical protein